MPASDLCNFYSSSLPVNNGANILARKSMPDSDSVIFDVISSSSCIRVIVMLFSGMVSTSLCCFTFVPRIVKTIEM